MSRNSLRRQMAVDCPSPSPTPNSRKLRKTGDLVALNFSALDEPKSAKSAKYTRKKTDKTDITPIDAKVVERKILKARRYVKKDNNDKSTTVQQNYDKIHNLFDKVADKYFDFQKENEDKENSSNNKTLDSIKEHEIINRKSTVKSPRQTPNIEKNTMAEKPSNLIINKKKRNTIHMIQTPNGDNAKEQDKRLKSRRTIHNLNETFSMDEERDSNEDKPAKKRRTYELNITVNNIEDLKNLEQNNRKSKSSSLIFEDVQLEEDLKPSIDDRRETFTVPPQSLLKEISTNKTTVDSPVLIDLCKSLVENVSNAETELSKSVSRAYLDGQDTLSTSYQPKSPINKRLNFSNITLRSIKNNSKLEDSVIVIDDTTLIDKTNDNIALPSTSKMSIFKTPHKKITELQQGFISSTPSTVNKSQKKADQSSRNSKFDIKSNSKQSRVNKMPNFALLHQKAFNGMEDIVEYEKRKKERAKLLLSGKKPSSIDTFVETERVKLSGRKPSSVDSIIDNTPSSILKNKRLVTFAPDFEEKPQPADFIPLPSTPFPKFSKNVRVEDTPPTPPTPLPTVTKTAEVKFSKNVSFKGTPPLATTSKTELKLRQATPGPFREKLAKLNVNPFSIKPKTPKPTVPVRGNLNRFGFKIVELPKVAATTNSRKEQIKAAIVNKTKFGKKNAEDRRNVIKGVRSNRRFDLLMKMRNIDN